MLMRRGWKNLIFETITPVMFVIAGFGLISLTFLYPSPERRIQTKLFPLPQRILVNEYPVIDSQLVKELERIEDLKAEKARLRAEEEARSGVYYINRQEEVEDDDDDERL